MTRKRKQLLQEMSQCELDLNVVAQRMHACLTSGHAGRKRKRSGPRVCAMMDLIEYGGPGSVDAVGEMQGYMIE